MSSLLPSEALQSGPTFEEIISNSYNFKFREFNGHFENMHGFQLQL